MTLIRNHSPETREVLRRAGMSQQSELTREEVQRAEQVPERFPDPHTPYGQIYHFILHPVKDSPNEKTSEGSASKPRADRTVEEPVQREPRVHRPDRETAASGSEASGHVLQEVREGSAEPSDRV